MILKVLSCEGGHGKGGEDAAHLNHATLAKP
jgi:hypothetical protein